MYKPRFTTIALVTFILLITGCSTPQSKSKSRAASSPATISQYEYIIEAIKQIEKNKTKIISEQQKEFVAEYTHQKTKTDSQIISREKAITEVKALLFEQVTKEVTNALDIEEQISSDQRISSLINKTIQGYAAGSTKVQTLDGKWNGQAYYIKGKLTIDPRSIIEGIAQGLKAEADRKTIADFKAVLAAQQDMADIHSEKMKDLANEVALVFVESSASEVNYQESKKELEEQQNQLKEKIRVLDRKLAKARRKSALYEAQVKSAENQLAEIESLTGGNAPAPDKADCD